jgi:poly(hydroxyalkanoate) depolymerase family esterase
MNDSLWSRIRGFFARLFGRAPPAPGRFVAGRKFSWHGRLAANPWAWPSREYLVYVPRGYSRWRRRPLIVLLHGCKQTPEQIATGTRIAALADRNGWLVLLPRQTQRANPWSCWNWFDARTATGDGEAAIVRAQLRSVRRRYRAHPRRIFVAGMSAGGALAATLGLDAERTIAGVFVHSGIACGAASSPLAALDVLAHGADTRYERVAAAARARSPDSVVPLCAVQGGRDEVVAEINAVQLVRQYLVRNGRLEAADRPAAELPQPDAEASQQADGGRTVTTTEYRIDGRVAVRLVRVPELGHAWSGGDDSLPYNDAAAPDATALLGEFIVEQIRNQRTLRSGGTRWPSPA